MTEEYFCHYILVLESLSLGVNGQCLRVYVGYMSSVCRVCVVTLLYLSVPETNTTSVFLDFGYFKIYSKRKII